PDPAGVLSSVWPEAWHGGDRSVLGRWLVHFANRKNCAPRRGDRHRSDIAGGCAGALDGSRRDDCSFIVGDAYDITRLWPEPVDLVFMANAFHGVPDAARLATAVKAALKPSGRFAIVNWHARPREETTVLGEARGPKTELRLTPEKTIEAVKMDGLKFLTLIEIPPYHYGAIFERALA